MSAKWEASYSVERALAHASIDELLAEAQACIWRAEEALETQVRPAWDLAAAKRALLAVWAERAAVCAEVDDLMAELNRLRPKA